MELTPGAVDYLARVGHDPVYGARPLKRAIQTELMDPLALKLLSGEILDGQLVRVDVRPDGEGLVITTGTHPGLSMVEGAEEEDE